MYEIKLGDKVRDRVTGYTGTVTAITHRLYELIHYEVASEVDKDGDFRTCSFVLERIELVKE